MPANQPFLSSYDQGEVKAGASGARFVLFAGEPYYKDPVFGSLDVPTLTQQLAGFKRTFTSGEMGA